MAQEDQIAQVLGLIPNLTAEQIDSLVKFDTAPLDAAVEVAEQNYGFEADRQLARVNGSYVAIGVIQVARTAILGILSGDSSLTAPWTGIVGSFAAEEATLEAQFAPVAPIVPAGTTGLTAEFTGTLTYPADAPSRKVNLIKVAGENVSGYLEVGTNNVWLDDVLTDIVPVVDPSAGAI